MAKKAASSRATSAKASSAKSAIKKQVNDVLVSLPKRAPTHEQIAERAFLLYLARGASDGGAMNDWLRAEHELSARA